MDTRQRELFPTEPAPWQLDEDDEQLVATVVFADPPHGPYDYLVPHHLHREVEPGRRVRVPLGRGNRSVTGYCTAVENRSRTGRELKPIKSVIDSQRLLSPKLLRLTQWMSDYYFCQLGQVIETAVPTGVRGQAGTREMAFLSVPNNVVARLTQLKLPVKQANALQILAASTNPLTAPQLAHIAGCTQAPITALRKKGLIQAEIRRIQKEDHDVPSSDASPAPHLTDAQQSALGTIVQQLDRGEHQTVLIHGITGSGKTEVYIRAIEHVIGFGRQAIVLVPEISLTPQTRQRFRSRFQRVAVLHSHLSDPERHFHWQRIAQGQVEVVVGARSAVFAPTPHLGLIVIDEEHDASFKQDKAPRYHARDVALQRACAESIPLVLGSATPSLESWYEAQQGRYRLVDMPHRVLERRLPQVGTIDLRTESLSRGKRGAISRPLHSAIRQAVEDGGQVILLLNRRGFSTSIQCPACGHVVRCPNCDIALTHHSQGEMAVCHYCDYRTQAPVVCGECRFEGIRYSGLGTQRLEAEVRSQFEDVTCLRMDSDTMKKPGSHEDALSRFRAGEIQILLGTQMIAKGLDFPGVTLVGVINADTALHLPDFRAAERTFQLVTQVAGRTGRGDQGGRVLVQTFDPEHPAIQAATQHDFLRFVQGELPSRQRYGYPPFSHMVRWVARGSCQETTKEFSEQVGQRIQEAIEKRSADARLLGPAAAPIARLRGRHRFHLLVSASDQLLLRELVTAATESLKPPDDVQWILDIDPIDML